VYGTADTDCHEVEKGVSMDKKWVIPGEIPMVAERKLAFLLVIFVILFPLERGLASSRIDGDEGGVAMSTAAELILWHGFEPDVISAAGNEAAELSVQTNGSPTRLQLVLASGLELPLAPQGNGLYTVTVNHGDALFGYQPDDVNRNFVGYLDVYENEERLLRGNMFINVHDSVIPEVAISDIAPDIRVSGRVFNLHLPDIDPKNLIISEITQRFYQYYPDEFDFINVVSIPAYFGNRYFSSVQNKVEGIGLDFWDNSERFGSAGRLQGFIRFPVSYFYDLASRAYVHEMGHNWINFLSHPKLQGVSPHWPISFLAPGVMGYQVPTNSQGLSFPFDLVSLPNDRYRLDGVPNQRVEFNGVDLYLMGLGSAAQAGSYIVFENQDQAVCGGCILEGPVVEFTAQDVIEHEGPRVPAYPNSQIAFRAATIVVSRSRPLNDREMQFYDYFAARGESKAELTQAQGFAKGSTYPFFVATGRIGSLSTALDDDIEFQINPGLNDAWYNPETNGQGFFVNVFPDAGSVFLAWFTFDLERPDPSVTARLGEPGHRWLTAQGAYSGNQAVLEITITSGGVFDSTEPAVSREADGEIILEFSGCNSGTVTYDIPSIGRQGIVPIQRVALDNVALCESLR